MYFIETPLLFSNIENYFDLSIKIKIKKSDGNFLIAPALPALLYGGSVMTVSEL
jgi:hypothetical protein